MKAELHDEFTAALADLVGRTGASQLQVRESNEEDPTVFVAVAVYPDGRFESDSGRLPIDAIWRVAERLVDGGQCTHCRKATGLLEPEGDLSAKSMRFLGEVLCWYTYDPVAKRYRMGCQK